MLHYCEGPLLDWGGELSVFVVRPYTPNRDARTVMVLYEYMYRATPNIYIYIYIYYSFFEMVTLWSTMELFCQVCLHIQGICYSDRSSTVQQNDSNRTGHRK